jgi:uncharacterized GH25 family protein
MRTLVPISFLLLLVVRGFAHDYWIDPETFTPAAGHLVPFRLLVGDDLQVETERSFEKKATVRFQIVSSARSRDLIGSGVEGKTPFAKLNFDKDGTHWVGLERDRRSIRLEAEKFNDYLTEEGLNRVLEQRRLAKEDTKPARERYSRYLKCLIVCGGKSDDTWKKTFDHRLEIVPLANPATVEPGKMLKVRVLFEGKPLPDVALFALHREADRVHKQKLKTAKDGTAEVKITHAGPWLLRMVHMRRCADRDEADWESFWTSLAFAAPAR